MNRERTVHAVFYYVTNKPPAMRVRIEGYTKKTPIAIQ